MEKPREYLGFFNLDDGWGICKIAPTIIFWHKEASDERTSLHHFFNVHGFAGSAWINAGGNKFSYTPPPPALTEFHTLDLRATGSQLVVDTIEDALRQVGLALFDEVFQLDSSLNWVFGEKFQFTYADKDK